MKYKLLGFKYARLQRALNTFYTWLKLKKYFRDINEMFGLYGLRQFDFELRGKKNEEALLVKSTTASTRYIHTGYPHTHVVFLQHWLGNVSITTSASPT